jgi:hypothetical protein
MGTAFTVPLRLNRTDLELGGAVDVKLCTSTVFKILLGMLKELLFLIITFIDVCMYMY